jgi:hypothetical protein
MSDFKTMAHLQRLYARHRWAATRGMLLAIVLNAGLFLTVSPAMVVLRHFDIPAYPPDAVYVSRKVVREYRHETPDVVVLGGSSMRDAVPPQHIAAVELSKACGESTGIFNAATSAQHPTDGWAILDAMHGPAPRLVVIGLTYGRLSAPRNRDPYDFSKQVVELPRSPSAFWIGVGRADVRENIFDFFPQLRRLNWTFAELRKPPMSGRFRHFDDRTDLTSKQFSPSQKDYVVQKYHALEAENLQATAPAMTEYWTEFANAMQARGSKVLFVWTPISPEFAPFSKKLAPTMAAAFAQLSAVAPVFDMQRVTSLPTDDFRDPLHLNVAGRKKTWGVIARYLADHGACRAAKSVIG